MLGKDEMEESGGSMEMEPASHLPPKLAAAVWHHMWTAAPAICSAGVGVEEMRRSLMKIDESFTEETRMGRSGGVE